MGSVTPHHQLVRINAESGSWVSEMTLRASSTFFSWHKVKELHLPRSVRSDHYVEILSNLKEEFECGCLLKVPTMLLQSWYYDVVPKGNCSSRLVWRIKMMEYGAVTVIFFLEVADEDAVGVVFFDLRIGSHSAAVIISFPAHVCSEVKDFGFLNFIHGLSFDLVSSLVACHRLSVVDCLWNNLAQGWYTYPISVGHLFDIAKPQ